MSGKRQHFIPQFLQEGFCRPEKPGFTWVYRKNADCFPTNIANSGVESNFYTFDGDLSADDMITQAEGHLANLVRELRTSMRPPVDDPLIPQLLTHLEIRTRHLRQSFLEPTGDFLNKMFDAMDNETLVLKFAIRTLQREPDLLRHALIKNGQPPQIADLALQNVDKWLPLLMAQSAPATKALIKFARDTILPGLAEAAKRGHVRAIKRGIQPAARIQTYRGLIYRIAELQEPSLILGDSAVIIKVTDMNQFRSMTNKGENVDGVFLPLTPSKVLVGTPGGVDIDRSRIRAAAARCSCEYFIAHESSHANADLQSQIGSDASLISQAEVDQVLRDLMSGDQT